MEFSKPYTINVVYEKIEELKECMTAKQDDATSDMRTIRETSRFISLFNVVNKFFNKFLRFFSQVMPQVDLLYKKLQKRTSDPICIHDTLSKNLMILIIKFAMKLML